MPEVLTPHLSLPLPHPSNSLGEDVLRIRDAFTVLDQKIAALDTLLSSDDFTLDSVMELVAAIKANRDSIQALVLNNATKDQLSAEVAARTLAISNEAVARAEAISAEVQARSTALDKKQDKLATATRVEMEAGTESSLRAMSPQLIRQSVMSHAEAATGSLKSNVALLNFRIAVLGSLSVMKMVNGVSDEYEDQTGIDDPNSVGMVYDPVVDCYTSWASYGAPGGTGNRTGSISVTTNLAITAGSVDNLVDGAMAASTANDLVQWTYNSDISNKFILFDFGAGVAKIVKEITLRSNQSENVTRGYWKWQGSNDGVAWTALCPSQQLAVNPINVWALSNSVAYRYYRLLGVSGGIDCASGIAMGWGEVEFRIATSGAKSLISESASALSSPASAVLILWEEDIDAIALNSDIQGWVSREAGKTFTVNSGTSSSVLNCAAHGYVNGSRVGLVSSAADLPLGLTSAAIYYVVEATTDTLKVSLTQGGAAVTFSDNGTGTHTVRRFSQATLAADSTLEATGRILSGSADLSGQDAGTSIRYAVVFPSGAGANMHAASVMWR